MPAELNGVSQEHVDPVISPMFGNVNPFHVRPIRKRRGLPR
jgi:hypothetical protein